MNDYIAAIEQTLANQAGVDTYRVSGAADVRTAEVRVRYKGSADQASVFELLNSSADLNVLRPSKCGLLILKTR